ncbi:MAG: hypothetical protein LBS40_00175 [Burkholderiales bacterium]|nr:hypothetical protein [Burkholderiales bacterium]
MPRINTPNSKHNGPAPLAGGHQYLPYTDALFLTTLQSAIHIIDTRIYGDARCDKAFKALPAGRTFAQIWMDISIWINFDPSRQYGDYGAKRGNDITITAFSLEMGRWTVAATLIHELAHVNGAPGNTHQAEATLQNCLLPGLEDPTIIGKLLHSTNAGFA